MPVIHALQLKKYYQVDVNQPGVLGAFKSFFKREYKEVRAVDGLSFNIEEGELVGFIGPNGAGKTTTLKCLSGLLFPTSGIVSVLGFVPWERKVNFQKQISLVAGQKNQLLWDLPPLETFLLNKTIYEIPDKKFHQTLDELVKLLEMKDLLEIPVRKLSLGQRMKCELVAALIHNPQVLFLDEPTIGLDVVMQKKVRDFIKEYNKRFSATIILTSHYMEDVRELCKRVLIIDKGNLIFDGKLSEIAEKYAPNKVLKVIFSQDFDLKKLDKIGEIEELDFPKAKILVRREISNSAAAELLHHFPVADLNIEEVPIEDVIRQVFTGQDQGRKEPS
ncbi:MAG: ATP-binding cassette domain-containing protein [bacterium]|nr:ATP-binding cassette domain-containing protein [bacterium]